MKKTLLSILLLTGALCATMALPQTGAQRHGANLQPGNVVPSFTERNLDGQTVNFPADYKGKVVLLNFWATWCHPCVHEQPLLVAALKKFKNKNFEILGVTADDANMEPRIRAVMDQKEMTWPQIYQGKFADGSIIVDYFGNMGLGIPQNILIDGDTGQVLFLNPDREKLNDYVAAALEKKFGAQGAKSR